MVEGDPYEPLDEGSLTEMTLSDAVDEAFEEALADPGTAAARAVDAGRAGAPDQSARGARSPEPDPAQLAITARPPSAAAAFEADEVEVEVELDRADEGCAASAESADDEAAFEVDAWVERDTPPPSITYELAADAELDEPFRGEAASAAPDEVLAEPEPPARITPEDTELEEVTDPLERFDAEPEPLHALHQGVPISGALPEGVEVPGPLEALGDRQMYTTFASGEVWLFLYVSDEANEVFTGRAIDLLPQLVRVDGVPVVLLSLVDSGPSTPAVRRVALDPFDPDARGVLELLRDECTVRVAVFGPDGAVERILRLTVPRRRNVALILDLCDRGLRPEDAPHAAQVRTRALDQPPPVDQDFPVMVYPSTAAVNAAEALHRIEAVLPSVTPAMLERGLTVLGAPFDAVRDGVTALLYDAFEHGVAVPDQLIGRARQLGLVPREASPVRALSDAFVRSLDRPHGLDASEIARNWRRMLELAEWRDEPLDSLGRALAAVALGQHDEPSSLPPRRGR